MQKAALVFVILLLAAGGVRAQTAEADRELFGGLIPCARSIDTPSTSYDETQPCGLQHLFLLFNTVLNFVLWKLGLLVLGALAVAAAGAALFSFGFPGLGLRIKAAFRAALWGYLLVLLAWVFVNLILRFFGVQFQWWIISF